MVNCVVVRFSVVGIESDASWNRIRYRRGRLTMDEFFTARFSISPPPLPANSPGMGRIDSGGGGDGAPPPSTVWLSSVTGNDDADEAWLSWGPPCDGDGSVDDAAVDPGPDDDESSSVLEINPGIDMDWNCSIGGGISGGAGAELLLSPFKSVLVLAAALYSGLQKKWAEKI